MKEDKMKYYYEDDYEEEDYDEEEEEMMCGCCIKAASNCPHFRFQPSGNHFCNDPETDHCWMIHENDIFCASCGAKNKSYADERGRLMPPLDWTKKEYEFFCPNCY